MCINTRRVCAARVTVVGSICLSMLPRLFLFIPQTTPSTERVTTISLIEPFFSEHAMLQRSERCHHSTHTNSRSFLLRGKRAYATTCHLFFSLESRGRGRSEVSFALAIMSPNKVYPQCQASLYVYKWKNHFYEMKGDVGMSVHEKERKQEDAYTKTQTHS